MSFSNALQAEGKKRRTPLVVFTQDARGMLVHSISFLVKLNTHQVIDLLPERAVESAAAWMRSQSEIEYVSRARGNDYAQAAQEGAPQAASVADRFHFSKNLFEAIEPAVARCYKEIRKDLPKPIEPKLPSIKEWRPARDPAHQHHYQSRTLP